MVEHVQTTIDTSALLKTESLPAWNQIFDPGVAIPMLAVTLNNAMGFGAVAYYGIGEELTIPGAFLGAAAGAGLFAWDLCTPRKA